MKPLFSNLFLEYDEEGDLLYDSIKVSKLVEEFGTPLYLMSEKKIVKSCRMYKKNLENFYGSNYTLLYASKAFCCKHIYKIIGAEGFGADVVSGGELFTAVSSGFDPQKIYFHGNNKSYEELKMAVELNVGKIVVDNIYELNMLNEISKEHGKTSKILLRLNLKIDAHTHEFIKTSLIDSKFGTHLNLDIMEETLNQIKKSSHIELYGLHSHIGSQIFSVEPFILAARILIEYTAILKNKFDTHITELNLGGGFPIRYTKQDSPIFYLKFFSETINSLTNACQEFDVQRPHIVMEPGRSIVGNAGITVYKVGYVKDIPNVRRYVFVDGGMCDNPRYALYGAKYEALTLKNKNFMKKETVTIAGKYCESGDLISKDIVMEQVKPGDYIAVLSTGAYNYSMSSNYNRALRPPVVMVSGGNAKLIVKRETFEDLVRNDL